MDRKSLVLAAVATGVLLVGGVVVGLLATVVGVRMGDVTGGVVLRTLLVGSFVLLASRAVSGSGVKSAARAPVAGVLVGALLAYALDPFSWGGRTLFGQLVVEPGVLSVVLDALLWIGLAALGARWGAKGYQPEERPATPYG